MTRSGSQRLGSVAYNKDDGHGRREGAGDDITKRVPTSLDWFGYATTLSGASVQPCVTEFGTKQRMGWV